MARPAGRAAQWVAALLEAAVEIVASAALEAFDGHSAELACVFTGRRDRLACDSSVPLTRREPRDGLHHRLMADPDALAARGIVAARRTGDGEARSLSAAPIGSGTHVVGRRLARRTSVPLRERSDRPSVSSTMVDPAARPSCGGDNATGHHNGGRR